MPGLYTHTTRAPGTTLTADIYNSDHQNHIDNHEPQQMDDYSSTVTQMRSEVDPGGEGSESLATSLSGEIERLRFAIRRLVGGTQWYSVPNDTLNSIAGQWDNLQGSRMVFYQANPPTGWTQVTAINDRVLRVVSGNGGTTGGSWTISGLNVQNRTLSTSQIPSHRHLGGARSAYGVGDRTSFNSNQTSHDTAGGWRWYTSFTGGSNSHDHGISHDGNWRPSYINVIVAQKD